jgi:hypothetical protein
VIFRGCDVAACVGCASHGRNGGDWHKAGQVGGWGEGDRVLETFDLRLGSEGRAGNTASNKTSY